MENTKMVERKPELITVGELAEELRVPVSWVYRQTRLTGPGSMPRLAVGKYRRFRLGDVLLWLERQSRN